MKQDANEIPKSLSGTLKFSNPVSTVKEENQISEVNELISKIHVDPANFRYIANYGEINGGLLADLRHILMPILKENSELKTKLSALGMADGILIAGRDAELEIISKENQELKERLGDYINKFHKSMNEAQAFERERNDLRCLNAELLEALEAAYKAMSDSEDADGFDMKVFSKIESAINKAKAL